HRRLQSSQDWIVERRQVAVHMQRSGKWQGEDVFKLRRRVQPVTDLLPGAVRYIGEAQADLFGMSSPGDVGFSINANVSIGEEKIHGNFRLGDNRIDRLYRQTALAQVEHEAAIFGTQVHELQQALNSRAGLGPAVVAGL